MMYQDNLTEQENIHRTNPVHKQLWEHTSHSCHELGFYFAASQTFPTSTELLAKQMNVFSFLSAFSSQSGHGSASIAGQEFSNCFHMYSS